MEYSSLSTPDYGNVVDRDYFADAGIHPLWAGMPRIAGPAFTVQLASGDNLMLHVAIHEAPPGSIIVVNAVDERYAVAGGNVCAVARERGIQGFVIDGVIRDLGEVRDMQFPVFARGIFPVPGAKQFHAPLNQPITCGGAPVRADDIVVADEEGIVFLPGHEAASVFSRAEARFEQDRRQSLKEWRKAHQEKVMAALGKASGETPLP